MQTDIKTVSSSNTGYIFNFKLTLVSRNHISEIISHEIDLIFGPFPNSLFSLSRFGSFHFLRPFFSQRRLELNRFAFIVRKRLRPDDGFHNYYNDGNRLDLSVYNMRASEACEACEACEADVRGMRGMNKTSEACEA